MLRTSTKICKQIRPKILLGTDSTVTDTQDRSTVTAEGDSLVALPGGSPRWPVLLVSVTFTSQATELLACRGQTTQLTVLVHRVAEPVDPGVIADGIVSHINKDNLEVFVGTILCSDKNRGISTEQV